MKNRNKKIGVKLFGVMELLYQKHCVFWDYIQKNHVFLCRNFLFQSLRGDETKAMFIWK